MSGLPSSSDKKLIFLKLKTPFLKSSNFYWSIFLSRLNNGATDETLKLKGLFFSLFVAKIEFLTQTETFGSVQV